MKKKLILALLFAGIFSACVVGRAITNQNVQFCSGTDGRVAIRIIADPYEELIYPYYCANEDIYYFFMPSVLCERTVYNNLHGAELYIDGAKINQYLSFKWDEDRIYQINYNGVDISAKFVESSDIPVLFISTDSEGISGRGTVDVFETDGTISYSGGLSLRGRGNSTYVLFEKKPYNIKLDHAAGILGMELDKDWCLLANSWDYSYMNNKLAFDMSAGAGFRYVPEAEYADVYFNGNYWGLYLITEKVEVDKDRIDITDLKEANKRANPNSNIYTAKTFDYGNKRGVLLDNIPDDITGGYLLERDYRLGPDYPARAMTKSYFETEFGIPVNIKFPEYASEEEVDYISTLTNEMEQAIRSPDGYSETGRYYLDYIDLSSWVKWYMVAEIAYDLDKDGTNTYFYKDTDEIDPKFYMGPVWDYDCRFGGTQKYYSAEILTKLNVWIPCLYEKSEFFDEICRVWDSYFREYLSEDAQTKIDLWREMIHASVEMDNVRWPRTAGYPVTWPYRDEEFTDAYSFDYEVDYLKNWVYARFEFLDSYWHQAD